MIEKIVSAIEKLLEDEGKQHNKIQSSGDLDKAIDHGVVSGDRGIRVVSRYARIRISWLILFTGNKGSYCVYISHFSGWHILYAALRHDTKST